MVITSNQEEQFIGSVPRFVLESPGENPFEAIPTTSITNAKGSESFEFDWIQKKPEIGIPTAEKLLEDIIGRSKLDVDRFPASAEAHANLGLALTNRGKYAEAMAEFIEALKLSPNHFMSMANLARINLAQGNVDEARRIYEQMVSAYPSELLPVVNLAYILLRSNKHNEAIETLKKAVDANPNATFPRYLMAISLLTLGKSHEAIRQLRLASRSDVRSPAIHQALGVAYIIAGDAKNAVRSFKAALTLAPEMKDAVHALANVLLKQGHIESLVELLAAYLQRQPNDLTARDVLSDAHLQLGQYPAARWQLTTALRQTSGEDKASLKHKAKLLNNIGYCFDRQGESDAAVQWFNRSIAVDPHFNVIPYHNLARYHAKNRDFDHARQILEKCKDLFPDDHSTPVVEGFVLVEQSRYDEAIVLMKNDVASGKATADSYAMLGWLLTDAKSDLDAAETYLFKGLERSPQHPVLVNNLAYTLLMHGQPEAARNVLMSLKADGKSMRPEDKAVLTATWGLLHFWENDLKSGIECYQRAETIAFGSSQRNLPKVVRQKMHLELAKTFLRRNDLEHAKGEIEKGLAIKDGRSFYEHDLTVLNENFG